MVCPWFSPLFVSSLSVEEVSGTNLLTNFYGMDLTTDKLRSLVRKWHSLIEAHADVKTTDGYILRVFVIGFTKSRPNQRKKTSYAQHAQVKQIRKKMVDILNREASSVDLNDLVAKLIPESIGKEIEKAAEGTSMHLTIIFLETASTSEFVITSYYILIMCVYLSLSYVPSVCLSLSSLLFSLSFFHRCLSFTKRLSP